MAVTKLAGTNGNWTTAGTWKDCDATAENDSEATTAVPPTSSGATSRSNSFVLPATTVDAVAIKIASRSASPTGTITVKLRNSTTSTDVLTVSCNVSDLPAIASVSPTAGGWFVFKFGSTTTPNGTDSWVVDVITSSGSMVSLYASSGNNWAREVRYSAASGAAPASGDKLLVSGEFTGAGTSNTWTVTYNNTASTIWGASAGGNAIEVGPKGILSQECSASTAYLLNFLGRFLVAGGGQWAMAGAGSMPSTSSLTCTAQNASNVDCGFEWRNLGTVTLTGASLSFVSTKLAADAAASATSLTTVDSTGWKNTNVIALAATTRTASECESKALTADASGTTLTISALTNAHTGTNNSNGDIRGELGNLTRNIVLQGNTSTLGSYIFAGDTAVVTLRYIERTKIGSGVTGKRGIDVQTTTGTYDDQFGSIHDCTVSSSIGINISSASGSNITVSNNVFYNIAASWMVNVATSGVQTISGNLGILTITGNGFSFVDGGSTYTNNTAVGAAGNGISITAGAAGDTMGTFSGNVAHCNSVGMIFTNINGGTASSLITYRNTSNGLQFQNVDELTIDTLTVFGNTTTGIEIGSGSSAGVLIKNATIHAGQSLTQPSGVRFNNTGAAIVLRLESCMIGSPNTHSTADIRIQTYAAAYVIMHNCLLASSTEVSQQTLLTASSYIASQKHDQSAGNHKVYSPYGILSIDTTASMFDVTPSERLTPNNASNKLESAPLSMGFKVAVASGGAVTASIKVRKSVVGDGTAYNGNQPRLIVRKNVAAGISSDTVLATSTSAGNGAFETLSGTTAAVSDDAVLEFIVDCDGTQGWVDIDTFAQTGGATDYGSLKYWFNAVPQPGQPSAGGGALIVGSSIVQPILAGRVG